MSKLSLTDLRKARDAAVDVLDILAGKEGEADLIRNWDFLNDNAAPPAIVKAMADELINIREKNQRLRAQRIADRRRFANPSPEEPLLVRIQREAKDALMKNALGMKGGN